MQIIMPDNTEFKGDHAMDAKDPFHAAAIDRASPPERSTLVVAAELEQATIAAAKAEADRDKAVAKMVALTNELGGLIGIRRRVRTGGAK